MKNYAISIFIADVVMSASISSTSSSQASSDNDNAQWEVSEILAERTTVTNVNEVLVVWKTSWIPVSQLDRHGPVFASWRSAHKWRSYRLRPSDIQVSLPCEHGSRLAADLLFLHRARSRELAAASVQAPLDRSPRKSLSGVAKRHPRS